MAPPFYVYSPFLPFILCAEKSCHVIRQVSFIDIHKFVNWDICKMTAFSGILTGNKKRVIPNQLNDYKYH